MSLRGFLRFAALLGLVLFSMAGLARAQSYDLANDWRSTYPNSVSVAAATQATWGAGNAWSAGELSSNWTNQQAVVGDSSLQVLTTYYNANTTGNLTSGGTVLQTFTYTVPFQAYQFDPGSTINQQVGQTFTQQLASGFKPEQNGGSDLHAITLPTGFTSGGASSGYVTEVGAVEEGYLNNGVVRGFTTTGYFGGSRSFDDGDGAEPDATSGVFYNYATTNVTNMLATIAYPASASSDTVTMNNFFGPAYVAWTAPAAGTISVNTSAWDPLGGAESSDGCPSFYVITSTLGPASPILSASSLIATDGAGSQYANGDFRAQPSSTVPGSTISDLGPMSGYSSSFGLNWISGQLSVSAGEMLYFVSDPGHNQVGEHGNHSAGALTDPLAVQAFISYTPEPSSVVLAGIGFVASACVLWMRRRSPAALANDPRRA